MFQKVTDNNLLKPEGFGETFAEMDGKVKNRISHRSKALAQLKEFLEDRQ